MAAIITDNISVADATILKPKFLVGLSASVKAAQSSAMSIDPNIYRLIYNNVPDPTLSHVSYPSVVPKSGFLLDKQSTSTAYPPEVLIIGGVWLAVIKNIYNFGIPVPAMIESFPPIFTTVGPIVTEQFASWQWSAFIFNGALPVPLGPPVPVPVPTPFFRPTTIPVGPVLSPYSNLIPAAISQINIPRGLVKIVTQTISYSEQSGDAPPVPDVSGDRSWISTPPNYKIVAGADFTGQNVISGGIVPFVTFGTFIRINALCQIAP